MADLTTVEAATAALPSMTDAQVADLPRAIAAASAACERYCGRPLSPTAFVEEYAPGNGRTIALKRRGVLSVSRVASGLSVALRVARDAGSPRPTAGLAWSGQAGRSATRSLVLTSIVAGVAQPIDVPFSTYPTVGVVASTVDAVAGWSAEATPAFLDFPATDLRHPLGPLPAGGTGAQFLAYATELEFDVDGSSLILRRGLPEAYRVPDRTWGSHQSASSVLVEYTAGYASVPADVEQACLLTIRAMVQAADLGVSTMAKVGDLQESYATYLLTSMPDSAKLLLGPHRSVGVF